MTGIEFEHFIGEIELAIRQKFKVINVRRELSFCVDNNLLIFTFNHGFHYEIDYGYLKDMLRSEYSHEEIIEKISNSIKESRFADMILK